MKYSSIYKEVAASALKNWYGKTDEDVQHIFSTMSNIQIEKHEKHGTWATESMIAGIKTYAKEVECSEIINTPTSKLCEMILNEDPFLTIVLEKATKQKLQDLAPEDIRQFKQKLYVDCLEAVHDQWAVSNVKKFFMEDREDRQYMHLPLELIGWKEIKKDLLFLEPIINAVGLDANMFDVEREYNFRRDCYKKQIFENGVKSFAKKYYDKLTEDIEEFQVSSENKDFTLEKFDEIIKSLDVSQVIARISEQSGERIEIFFHKPERLDYVSPQTKTALIKMADTINSYIELQKQNPMLDLESNIDSMRGVFLQTQKIAISETLDAFKKIFDDICNVTKKDEAKTILKHKKEELIEILKDSSYLLNDDKELKSNADKLLATFEIPIIPENEIKQQNNIR